MKAAFLFSFIILAGVDSQAQINCQDIFQENSIVFNSGPLQPHHWIVDSNIASQIINLRMALSMIGSNRDLFKKVNRYLSHGELIRINDQTFSEQDSFRMSQIVRGYERYPVPLAFWQSRSIDEWRFEGNTNSFFEEIYQGEIVLTPTVFREVFNRGFSFDESSHQLRAHSDDVIARTFTESRSRGEYENFYSGKDIIDPSRFFNTIFMTERRWPRESSEYRAILELLERVALGGGVKGIKDRQIVADAFTARRSDAQSPAKFVSFDHGIARGLIRLKLMESIPRSQDREIRVRKFFSALKSGEHILSPDIIADIGQSYSVHLSGMRLDSVTLPPNTNAFRVTRIKGIRLSPDFLSPTDSARIPNDLLMDFTFYNFFRTNSPLNP